jgi:protein-S-isoprenylcysteine O-methyltransferase Ste14
MNEKIIIPPYYFLFSILLTLVIWLILPNYNIITYPYSLFGLILIAIGVAVVGLAFWQFKKSNTTENFGTSKYLVKGGLYQFSRNPMYLAAVVFLIGLSVLSGNILSLISPVIFFMSINYKVIPYEERKSEKEFGGEYIEYKNNVNRWI